VKNITVTVDDDLYRRARIRAAEEATTVSSVVREQLQAYVAGPSDSSRKQQVEERKARLRALYDKIDAELAKRGGYEPVDPSWRDRMYDERFESSKLGQSLKRREA
jgi:plasmid stability protein